MEKESYNGHAAMPYKYPKPPTFHWMMFHYFTWNVRLFLRLQFPLFGAMLQSKSHLDVGKSKTSPDGVVNEDIIHPLLVRVPQRSPSWIIERCCSKWLNTSVKHRQVLFAGLEDIRRNWSWRFLPSHQKLPRKSSKGSWIACRYAPNFYVTC